MFPRLTNVPCWIASSSVSIAALAAPCLEAQCVRREDQKVVGSDSRSFDEFFRAALDGDTLVVGAAFHQVATLPKSGAAYVYRRDAVPRPDPWQFVQKLTAPVPHARDHFGGSTAVDGEWIAIGAPDDDTAFNNAGAVFLFHYHGSQWNFDQQILASDPLATDFFGDMVAMRAGLLVVSTPEKTANNPESGAVYVYRFDPSGSANQQWNFEQKLSSGLTQEFEGTWLATDGVRILTGAPGDSSGTSLSGSAYVYAFDSVGQQWDLEQRLLASDGAALDLFGSSLAIDGDQAFVGAPQHDHHGTDAGACYVFDFDAARPAGQRWQQRAGEVVAGDAFVDDQFGIVVSSRNGTLAIGSFNDVAATDSGAGYVFSEIGGTWVQRQKLIARDGAFGDTAAWTVTDGSTVMLGAVEADGTSLDSGAVHVYELADLGLSTNLQKPMSGDSLEFTTFDPNAAGLALLYLIQVDSTPLVFKIASGIFDASGCWSFGGTVPPGLSGFSAAFLSFGLLAPSGIGISNVAWLQF